MRALTFSSASFFQSLKCSLLIVCLFPEMKLVCGQYFTLGLCPRVGGMPHFNISRYEGLWYEVEKYWFAFEATASCVNVKYVANPFDSTFGVEINMLEEVTRNKISLPGLTWYQSRDGSGDFNLELLITPSPLPCNCVIPLVVTKDHYQVCHQWETDLIFRFRYPYLVLDTDYDNYTIKYRCKQLGPISMQTLWILSRTKEYKPESRERVHDFLRRVGINVQKLRRSNTGTCEDIQA